MPSTLEDYLSSRDEQPPPAPLVLPAARGKRRPRCRCACSELLLAVLALTGRVEALEVRLNRAAGPEKP